MDGWYANFVSNSTKVYVVLRLSWGFDNNTYEIPEGNYVCLCPINAAFAKFYV